MVDAQLIEEVGEILGGLTDDTASERYQILEEKVRPALLAAQVTHVLFTNQPAERLALLKAGEEDQYWDRLGS